MFYKNVPGRSFNRIIFPLIVTLATTALLLPATAQGIPTIPGSSSGPDGLIWLPNYGRNSVQAFDPETLEEVASIPDVGDHPLVMKELPDHSKIFVGNFGPVSWNVSVVDVATKSVITRIPTLGAAYAVSQLSHDGRYLYVPTSLSVMQVIDTQTYEVIRTLPIALPPGPAHIEMSLDDAEIYVYSALGTATKYNAVTGALTAPPIFLNGFAPGWGATSADGSRAYAVNYVSGISTIDTNNWQILKTVPMSIDAGPISATITPNGKQLWVCNYIESKIYIIDTESGNIVNTISTAQAPVYVGFSADGTKAYTSLVDGDSGLPQSMYAPLIPGGTETALANAYVAGLLDLDTTLAVFDTDTLKISNSATVKGAFVAGVYPD